MTKGSNEAYQHYQLKIEDQIRNLENILEMHAVEQDGRKDNWAYSGELSYISAKLEDAILFLASEEDKDV